jgi:manganese oxidase
MSQRVLVLLSASVLLVAAFAGCFGGKADEDPKPIDGSKLPPFETTIFIHPMMFHPYPGAMLSAWMLSESKDPPTSMSFDPPVIRVREGQTVRITLINTEPDFPHTLHWHGLHVPWEMDGVPYLTQDPVDPNTQFTYEFVAKPAGTHWFHCHVDSAHHLDMGMYGILIVEPAVPDRIPYQSEDVLVFDDWDSKHLHQQGNDPQMTVDSTRDNSGDPFNQIDKTKTQVRETYNDPRYPFLKDYYQNPARYQRDPEVYGYPVTHAPWTPVYDTYTINGKSYPYTEAIALKEGETKKLRLVNVGNTVFSIHLHGHHFQVTHTDGYPLPAPYWKDTLLIGPGERYDIVVHGDNPGIWMLHSHNGLHEMNDHIFPGGLMTHLVYEGFDAPGGHGHTHAKNIPRLTAADFLGLYR